ncbi:MAG: signal peptidase I [Firmicutes bacterium]|nr:signal peptidase I [Bacillota bacterium]
MSDKINVFEILGQEHTELDIRGQEHTQVPDPDFNDAINQLEQKYMSAPAKPVQPLQKKAPAPAKPAQPPQKKVDKRHDKKRVKRNDKSRDSVRAGKRAFVLKMMLALALVLLFFTFVLNISRVSGDSMEPALSDGDRVVINRLARNFEEGDIIVFKTDSGSKMVKRIIAVDGDVVNITPDEGLFVNGIKPEEDYIFSETAVTDIGMSYPVIIDEDEYFVLGDNRMNSKDSRNTEVGVVQKNDVVGKVIFCIRKY